MNDEWRSIIGHEIYQVTACGKVRSTDRFIVEKTGMKRFKKGRILKTFLGPSKKSKTQYRYFNVKRGVNIAVHRAVAQAWLNPAPNGFDQVNHIDGNSLNNNVNNLEWSNKRHNMEHAIKIGLYKNYGENHTFSKLTKEQVEIIRYLCPSNNNARIASLFGVTTTTIRSIRLMKAWKQQTFEVK